MAENGTRPSGFAEIWQSIWPFRERAKSRRGNLPRVLDGEREIDPAIQMANAQREVLLWAKAKELSNHREAFEHTIQPEVTSSINRLFSPVAAPHEVNFDRGVIYAFFVMVDKMTKADSELIKAQAKVTALEKEFKYAGE